MQPGTPLDTDIRDAYLARLGFDDVPPPTAETLVALHRAQVERVPYETLWIALGERRGIDLLESARIIVNGRAVGGYCYHLNGAFSVLLEWLGFDVHRHLGGVRPKPSTAMPDPPIGWGNHLAMTIDLDGRTWMVDAGLGDAIHEPIPLVEGDVFQGPFTFHVSRRPPSPEAGTSIITPPARSRAATSAPDRSARPSSWSGTRSCPRRRSRASSVSSRPSVATPRGSTPCGARC